MLGIGRSTVYELIAGGRLEIVHIGRSARVPLAALIEFVDGLRGQSGRRDVGGLPCPEERVARRSSVAVLGRAPDRVER